MTSRVKDMPKGWRLFKSPSEVIVQLGDRSHVWKGRTWPFRDLFDMWRREDECDCDECRPDLKLEEDHE